MQQEKIRTIHVYFEEEEPPIVDAEPEQDQPAQKIPLLAVICFSLVVLLCVGIPALAILIGQAYPDTYDLMRSETLTLTLALHPVRGQLPLYTLPTIRQTQHLTVSATGSQHQDATRATGLITFYNGAFTTQTVRAGTNLTGRDGVTVVTQQTAVIPPATATTPPTYGTVSVTATDSSAGAAGNIPASDINQACCGTSILAQNLYAFSGGHDAQDIAVLTKGDISNGRQALSTQIDEAVNYEAQQETKPGNILFPLDCAAMFSTSHEAGEQAVASLLTFTKTCTPLAYSAVDIEKFAQQSIAIPRDYHLVSFSALVLRSNLTAQGGTLTVEAIAYLKHDTRHRFAGK